MIDEEKPTDEMVTLRTWEELSNEVQNRADLQRYPLTGMRPDDVREALKKTGSLNRDSWANSWSNIGDRYRTLAEKQLEYDKKKASVNYLNAWRFYGFAAWPTQNTSLKKKAFETSLDNFRCYADLVSPSIERVQLPFQEQKVTFYLQVPENTKEPVPLLLSFGGLDSYKEYVVERYGPDYLKNGFGYAALDIPGTGESPIKASVDAVSMYSVIIDYLEGRNDIDSSRLAVMGVSQGGYWSARLAIAEVDRLTAAVFWAGPTHTTFQRQWLEKSTSTNEYLFDYLPARLSIYGVKTWQEYLEVVPNMSIEKLGLLDAPTPEMLLVSGEKDTQTSIEDLHLLQRSGQPKYSWINPSGGHLRRSKAWPDERILKEVIIPFLRARLIN